MEDVRHSVPETPHISTDDVGQSIPEHHSVPQQLGIAEEVHPGTPEGHQEVSLEDSGVLSIHSGVPARQEWPVSTPTVHPGTPTEEDWELWTTIKARWGAVEKMLTDQQVRQAFLGTPSGTPRHTVKKTYVVETTHVQAIDDYARQHGMEIKDVVFLAFHQFFEGKRSAP